MKRLFSGAGSLLALLTLAMPVHAGVPSHADLIGKYEGAKSCAPCHKEAAREAAESLHYQHQAIPQFLADWEEGKPAGMMVSY